MLIFLINTDISILPGGSGVIHLHATRSSNYNTENLQFSDVTLSDKTVHSLEYTYIIRCVIVVLFNHN